MLELRYDAFNLPRQISRGVITDHFEYGPRNQRYLKHDGGMALSVYIDKLYERVDTTGGMEERLYVGSYLQVAIQGGQKTLRYLHKDRLGSTVAITDAVGEVDVVQGFGPFGRPRDGQWMAQNELPATLQGLDRRGFTGHEHLEDLTGIIHMNGRGYDFNLGRFLSVDPVIQFPQNSQSLNPYSYLMNNPMAGIDPTGYAGERPGKLDSLPKDVQQTLEAGGTVKIQAETTGSMIGETVATLTMGEDGKLQATVLPGQGQSGVADFTQSPSEGPRGVDPKESAGSTDSGGDGHDTVSDSDRPNIAGSASRTEQQNGAESVDSTNPSDPTNDDRGPQVVGYLAEVSGLSATLGQRSLHRKERWKGRNGKWYQTDWGGNQHVGSKSGVLHRARKLKGASQGFFLLEVGIDGYQFYSAYKSGDPSGMANAGIATAWSVGATVGGTIGLVGGAVYSGASALVDIPAVRRRTVRPIVDGACLVTGNC